MPCVLLADPPRILISADDPVLRLAAAELIRYTAASGGPSYHGVEVAPELVTADGPPAESPEPPAARLRLAAPEPRLLLVAVYRHLEQLGWRWYLPGPLGEVYLPGVPPPGNPAAPGLAERVVVDRSVDKEPAVWSAEALRLIDWMAKQGLGCLALERAGLAAGEQDPLTLDLDRRGLVLEVGGDIVPELLAATRAAERGPLRHRQGAQRERRLEVADEAALAALPAVAQAALAAWSPATALRLVEPGELPSTAPASSRPGSGRRLRLVAKALVDGLGASARLVVWQPTSSARRGFVAPPQACLVLEATHRDLARGLDEALDSRHVERLKRFSEELQRPGGLEVALPYCDPVPLRNLAGPLTRVIAADLRALAEARVRRVSLPVRGAFSWWAYPLNLYVFARCAADPAVDVDALLDDWCLGLYAPVSAAMRAWLDRYEATMAPLWRLREADDDPGIRAWKAGSPAGERVMHAVLGAVEQLDTLRDELAGIRAQTADLVVSARLDREAEACELTRINAQLRLLHVQSRLGHPTLALHAAARELVTVAHDRLARLSIGACGLAIRREYLAVLGELAAWCGYTAHLAPGDRAS